MSDFKSIVIFGGSSEMGQKLTKNLAELGHSVVNIDQAKSDVAGVTRYPFNAGSSQTRGVLQIVKPDLILVCEECDTDSETQVLTYVGQLCTILSFCAEYSVPQIVVTKQCEKAVEVLDTLTATEVVQVDAELNAFKKAVYSQLEQGVKEYADA
jgi:hypothetical protein